jgi:hemerythrin
MLTWREEFATGSVLVDTQHRLLIEKINKLEQLLTGASPSKTDCDDLVGFLGNYAAMHFKFEEQCMSRYRCPAHEQNKQAHEVFLGVFSKFKERYLAEGPKKELLQNLHATASHWIQDHILAVDIKLKPCVVRSEAEQ